MTYEWVAPVAVAVLTLAGVVATAVMTRRNTLSTNESNRAPDVNEAWRETERARRERFLWEDLFYLTRGAWKGYIRRMVTQYGEQEAGLTEAERKVLEAPIPGDPEHPQH